MKNTLQTPSQSDNISEEINNMFKELEYDPRSNGAIIGYDSSTQTGGKGARLLGVGVNSQYARDTVTVGLRLISVSTGEILLTSTTSKSVISVKTQGDIFRWVDMGTMPVESEIGRATNEPANIAVRKAIERAVVDIVDKGEKQELWKFKGKDKPNLIIE